VRYFNLNVQENELDCLFMAQVLNEMPTDKGPTPLSGMNFKGLSCFYSQRHSQINWNLKQQIEMI